METEGKNIKAVFIKRYLLNSFKVKVYYKRLPHKSTTVARTEIML